jgi:hypothetical protein
MQIRIVKGNSGSFSENDEFDRTQAEASDYFFRS